MTARTSRTAGTRAALEQVAPYLGELHTRTTSGTRSPTTCARSPRRPDCPCRCTARCPAPAAPASTPNIWRPLLAELQGVARAHPEATW
ncbi:phenylacetate-CoA oxygenase subunit PaaI [Streptomyces thinghirensis]|nr:phenylacetate-CoA oxygenase subunit PaaI [Streptomyces thinghirensis]